MADLDESVLVDEILSALDTAGDIESWIDQRMLGSVNGELLAETFRVATQRLLCADPPKTDRWEHLLFTTAASSAKSNQKLSCEACKTAITELTQMIQGDLFATTASEHIVTLASALTMVLSAQRRLRQPIEVATRTLHEKFPDLMPVMAELCQDIWQRHGQMSGLVGLYLWDNRNNEWRLNQDFKPHRPT
jgi:hypothetical protein